MVAGEAVVVGHAGAYHFTPDILKLAVEALSRLNSGKLDVVVWLRSAGVPEGMLQTWEAKIRADRDSVRKVELARDVLCKLNEGGDRYLAQRREVLKRLVETEDFSTCWPEDRLPAQGLVARLREVVNVKDSFTRMALEREREAKQEREKRDAELARAAEKRRQLDEVRRGLAELISSDATAQERGRQFERLLTRLFELSGIQASEPFRTHDEQIDGAVYFDSHLYLVEARWWRHRLQYRDVADLYIKLANRPRGTRGLCVSASDFTDGCVRECSSPQLPLAVFVTLEDIVLSLESGRPLVDLLRRKVEIAGAERRIMVPFSELFP